MIWILIVVAAYFYTQATGYLMHFLMHKYETEAHNTHHKIYTPDDFTSLVYRDPGAFAAFYQHALYSLPVIPAVVGMGFVLPLSMVAVFLGTALLTAFVSAYIHDAFHLEGHWLCQYYWFNKLKLAHIEHHKDPRSNYGIFDLTNDKAFRSYR